MASEDELNLLVIVVDVNPIWWGQQAQREPEFTLSKCMDAVMVMGNSHMVMTRTNKLAIIASHCQDSHFLYPNKKWKAGNGAGDGPGDDGLSSGGDGKYELLSVANNVIAEEIRNVMSRTELRGHSTDTLLAGSLAIALCYIHRVTKELEAGQEIKSRILVIKAAEDCALQYMNFMNVIFAAQKQNIVIDACVLDSDSGLLQQACDITGGLYLRIPQKIALAQYLLWVFLPDSDQRSHLVLPPPVHVDYRAACFCHRNLIEIGYVCSVCLSIFCNFSPICTTCDLMCGLDLSGYSGGVAIAGNTSGSAKRDLLMVEPEVWPAMATPPHTTQIQPPHQTKTEEIIQSAIPREALLPRRRCLATLQILPLIVSAHIAVNVVIGSLLVVSFDKIYIIILFRTAFKIQLPQIVKSKKKKLKPST